MRGPVKMHVTYCARW